MPFVRIDVPKELPKEQLKLISDSVHSAMVEAIAIPENDRFQAISRHDSETLIYDAQFLADRPRSFPVFIQIFLRLGRTLHAKKLLYQSIVRKITAATDIPATNIMIILSENDLEDWSFSGGKTHYLDDPNLFAQRRSN